MTASQTAAAAASLLNVAIEALLAAQAAQATLSQAQSENWTQDDARWADPFKKLDDALAAAKARL